MRVMGIDPGGTTGIALINWSGEAEPTPAAYVNHTQLDWGTDVVTGLAWLLTNEEAPDLIAIEKFIITTQTARYTRQPEALYVIGGVLFLAALHGIEHVVMQTAANAKTAWPDSRLKETGWGDIIKAKDRHARDGLRHALTACLNPRNYRP